MTSIKDAADKAVLLGDVNIIRNTTPLAAIVFSRAKDRKDIARQIVNLREELSALRTRLVEAEDSLFFWATHDDEAIANAKCNSVFEELERRYGKGTGIVTFRSLVTFSEKELDSIIEKKWAKLTGLPIKLFRRYLARRPIFEIHRLAEQLPGNQRLCREVERLFGTVYP